MKETHLNVAARDCMVFIQPGGNETNTWKLVWLVKELSMNPIQGPQCTYNLILLFLRRHHRLRWNEMKWELMMDVYWSDVQHSISNFPGPQLIVHAENSKQRTLVFTQL